LNIYVVFRSELFFLESCEVDASQDPKGSYNKQSEKPEASRTRSEPIYDLAARPVDPDDIPADENNAGSSSLGLRLDVY
jgi:hypothetical protein